jgi:hypothetical protein
MEAAQALVLEKERFPFGGDEDQDDKDDSNIV